MATEDGVDLGTSTYLRQVNKCLTLLSEACGDRSRDNDDATCCICRRKGDVAPTSHQCISCGDTLCKSCKKGHRSSSATYSHVVVEYWIIKLKNVKIKARMVNSCTDHKERKTEYFCETCNKALCSLCLMSNHMKHTVVSLDEIVPKCRDQIAELCKSTLENVNDPILTNNTFSRHKEIINSIEKRTMMKVREKSQSLIDNILQEEKDLVKQVKYFCDKQRHDLESHENELKEVLECAKMVAELSMELVHDSCDEEVVRVSDDISKCLNVESVSQLRENILHRVANLKIPDYEIQRTFPQASPFSINESFPERHLSNLPDVVGTSNVFNQATNAHVESSVSVQDIGKVTKTATDENTKSIGDIAEIKEIPANTRDICSHPAELLQDPRKRDNLALGTEYMPVGSRNDSHNPLTIFKSKLDNHVDHVGAVPKTKPEATISNSSMIRTSNSDKHEMVSDYKEVELVETASASEIEESKHRSVNPIASSLSGENMPVSLDEDAAASDIKAESSSECDEEDEFKGLDTVDSTFKLVHANEAFSSEQTSMATPLLCCDGDDDADDSDHNEVNDGDVFKLTSSLSVVGDYGRSLSNDCTSGQTDMGNEMDDDSIRSVRSPPCDSSSTFTPTPLDCDVIPFDSFPQVSFGNFGPFIPYLNRIKSKRDSQNALCLIKEGTVTLTHLAKDTDNLLIFGMSLVCDDKLAVLDGGSNTVQLFTVTGKLCNKNHPNKLTGSFAPHSVTSVGRRVIYVSGATIYITDLCLNLLQRFTLSIPESEKLMLPLCRYKEDSVLIANLPEGKMGIYNLIDNTCEEQVLGLNGPIVSACHYTNNSFLVSCGNQPGNVYLVSSTGSLVRTYRPRGIDTWYPEGICVDSHLNVYVASPRDGKLYVFGTDGSQIYELECELPSPTCLVMKSDNTLIVSGLGPVLHLYKCTLYKKN